MFDKKPTRSLQALVAIENYVTKVAAQINDPDIRNVPAASVYGPIHLMVLTHRLMARVLMPTARDHEHRDPRLTAVVAALQNLPLYNPTEDSSRRHIPMSDASSDMFAVYDSLSNWFQTQHLGQGAAAYHAVLNHMQTAARLMIDALNQMSSYGGSRYVLLQLWYELCASLGAGFETYAAPQQSTAAHLGGLFAAGRDIVIGGQRIVPLDKPGQLVECDVPTAIATLCSMVMQDDEIKDKEQAIVANLDQWMTIRLARLATNMQSSIEAHEHGKTADDAVAVKAPAQEQQINEPVQPADWISERLDPVSPPFRMGVCPERELLEHNVTQVLRQAFRGATNYGQGNPGDFHPDRVISRALIGLFGPYTHNGESVLKEAPVSDQPIVQEQATPEVEPPLPLDVQRKLHLEKETGIQEPAQEESQDARLFNGLEQEAWSVMVRWFGAGLHSGDTLDAVRNEFAELAKRQFHAWGMGREEVKEDKGLQVLFVFSLAGKGIEAKKLRDHNRDSGKGNGRTSLVDALRCQKPADRIEAAAFENQLCDHIEEIRRTNPELREGVQPTEGVLASAILVDYYSSGRTIDTKRYIEALPHWMKLIHADPKMGFAKALEEAFNELAAEEEGGGREPEQEVDFIGPAMEELEVVLGIVAARKDPELANMVSDYDAICREALMVGLDHLSDLVRDGWGIRDVPRHSELQTAVMLGVVNTEIAKLREQPIPENVNPQEVEHLLLTIDQIDELAERLFEVTEVPSGNEVLQINQMIFDTMTKWFSQDYREGAGKKVVDDAVMAMVLNVHRRPMVDLGLALDKLDHLISQDDSWDLAEDAWTMAENAVNSALEEAASPEPDQEPMVPAEADEQAEEEPAIPEADEVSLQDSAQDEVLAEEQEEAEVGEALTQPAEMDFSYLAHGDGPVVLSERELNVVSVVPYNEIEVQADKAELENVELSNLVGFELSGNDGRVLVQVHATDEQGRDVIDLRKTDDGFILGMTQVGTWMNVSEDLREVTRLRAYFAS